MPLSQLFSFDVAHVVQWSLMIMMMVRSSSLLFHNFENPQGEKWGASFHVWEVAIHDLSEKVISKLFYYIFFVYTFHFTCKQEQSKQCCWYISCLPPLTAVLWYTWILTWCCASKASAACSQTHNPIRRESVEPNASSSWD